MVRTDSTSTIRHSAPSLGDRFLVVIATGFGLGFAPVAPGTFGTLLGIPFYLALSTMPAWLHLLSVAGFAALAVSAAQVAGRSFGQADDRRIVADEIAGLLVTLALVPVSARAVAAGFVLFRVMDVVKPWPASYFDRRVHNGVGVVADDLVAGLYARAALEVILRFAPW